MLRGFATLALALSFATPAAPGLAQDPKPPAGMDTYLFGILRSGKVDAAAPADAQEMQKEHRANMQRMTDAGILVGAGPLLDAGDYRGIFIFKADARAKVADMVKGDPLIRSGRLTLELLRWWGPERIGERYFAGKRANPGTPDRMLTYQLAFLSAGPSRKPDADPETERIQAAHMAHIKKMDESGKLVAAGPFLEENKLRGVFVFRLASLGEARALAQEDPAVQAGRLVLDTYDWLVADGVLPK